FHHAGDESRDAFSAFACGTGRSRTASVLRAQRAHLALGCEIPEPARTRGSMRCTGAVVLSNRGLPHLRNGADCRGSDLRPRAAGSARKGRRAYLLLPASRRGGARPMTDAHAACHGGAGSSVERWLSHFVTNRPNHAPEES